MKNGTKRWLYLLAGSALSAKEIKDLCTWLANDASDDIVASVMRLRRQELTLSTAAESEADTTVPSASNRTRRHDVRRDATAEIASIEITSILRIECRLTAREAAERLAAELAKEMRLGSVAAADVPVYSKESFRTYVAKLLQHASPQMLLHLAHRIRDGAVKRRTSAWPLRAGAS